MDFGVVQRVQGRSAHLAARFIARMGGSIRRFFRAVGYGGIIDLKAGSSEHAWPVVGPLGVFHQSGREDNQELPVARTKQAAAIAAVCDRAATALFGRAVRRLVRWRAVFVAGFQAKLGLGAQLVKTLKSVRPDVQRKDVSGRDFAEILLYEPCQILSDADRRLTVSKADAGSGPCRSQAAQPSRTCHPPYCGWAKGKVRELFTVQTALNPVWQITFAMVSSLIRLRAIGVCKDLGAGVEDPMRRVSEPYKAFAGHLGDPNHPSL